MNFWHMQLHPNDKESLKKEAIVKILKEDAVIGMGAAWDNDRGQPQNFGRRYLWAMLF
jgi:hypothetical protein